MDDGVETPLKRRKINDNNHKNNSVMKRRWTDGDKPCTCPQDSNTNNNFTGLKNIKNNFNNLKNTKNLSNIKNIKNNTQIASPPLSSNSINSLSCVPFSPSIASPPLSSSPSLYSPSSPSLSSKNTNYFAYPITPPHSTGKSLTITKLSHSFNFSPSPTPSPTPIPSPSPSLPSLIPSPSPPSPFCSSSISPSPVLPRRSPRLSLNSAKQNNTNVLVVHQTKQISPKKKSNIIPPKKLIPKTLLLQNTTITSTSTTTSTTSNFSTKKPKLKQKQKQNIISPRAVLKSDNNHNINNNINNNSCNSKHHSHAFGQFDSEKDCIGCKCNSSIGMLCSMKTGCGCFWVESECSSLCFCRNGERCIRNALKKDIQVGTQSFKKPPNGFGVRSMDTIPPFTLIIKCDQANYINGKTSTQQEQHFILVNHSPTPNATRESWVDSTGSHVGLFSCKTIKRGEEIFL